ncbi:Kdo(2)-lipid IV(A) acyltransferase [Acerihabitans sp. TG2]|uniref:Kdo(2)-lipid IV(A) acyltransferase n=1 Tax=Acerihabitans sp. TG2 TaxID=3096008 RepID=UPI002B229516|nr:Kdo(2)-lipid IV(A) acyltransferase [Acerihabitans sp. TG2]MEA9391971.1 Kdo(2)-lipid IV(A) acyltransferase [Acerihabitans sp. TG2]
MTNIPTFTRSLLHPRYWPIWIGIGLLYLVVLLPYPWLYRIGTSLGRLSMRFLPRRVKIARRNIELCFPHCSVKDRETLLIKNFESVGMGLIETGMGWFWSDRRVQRWFNISGLENIQLAKQQHKGVLLIGLHFLSLELGARIFGIKNPGIGVYRPNNNRLLDWLQTWGRMRSNKSMLNRSDIKGMIRALKNGEIIWYAPDHDYGPKSSVFAPLFAMEQVATTAGTHVLVRLAKPAVIPFVPRRLPNGQGYELIIQPDQIDVPLESDIATATYMNKVLEKAILLAPDQYMWLHRRFKTRPPGQPSLYS